MTDDARQKSYPDIADIVRRKEQGRRNIAARTFGEKLAMLEALRERLAPIRAAREANRDTIARGPKP